MIKDLYKKPHCICDVNVLESYHRIYKNLYDSIQQEKSNIDDRLALTPPSAFSCEQALAQVEHDALDHMAQELDAYFLAQKIIKRNDWKQDFNYDE
jgi:hypothetical protein